MPRRSKRPLVAESHWPSAHGIHSTAYGLGRDAGSAITALLGQRQDHATCSVEWYRGFCAGCGLTTDSKVEAYVAREAVMTKHGLARVAIISANLDAMIDDAQEVLGHDLCRKDGKS